MHTCRVGASLEDVGTVDFSILSVHLLVVPRLRGGVLFCILYVVLYFFGLDGLGSGRKKEERKKGQNQRKKEKKQGTTRQKAIHKRDRDKERTARTNYMNKENKLINNKERKEGRKEQEEYITEERELTV